MLKKILKLNLKELSKAILKKYKPEVIGITGSVGKTSAKDAIAVVLSPKFNIRSTIKNYNNEFGLPLTIIGCESPNSSIFGWIKVCFKALKLIIIHDKKYPKILILEMGIDKIGDMDYLLKIAKPKIGIVTNISESHLKFLESIENTQKEKGKLVSNLKSGGWAVLNSDDKRVLKMSTLNLNVNILKYGLGSSSDVKASDINFNYDDNGGLIGVKFQLSYKDSTDSVKLKKIVGKPIIHAALVGASVGFIYGLNIEEISKSLHKLKSPLGRTNLTPGIKNTLIIDDTYNSSPESSKAAINILNDIKVKQDVKRWAVLADMLELGLYTSEGHKKVGKLVAESKIDKLILIGERARIIARSAKNAGMKESDIYHFSNNDRAGRFLQDRIKQNDVILIKGSRGMHTEEIVEEIKKV